MWIILGLGMIKIPSVYVFEKSIWSEYQTKRRFPWLIPLKREGLRWVINVWTLDSIEMIGFEMIMGITSFLFPSKGYKQKVWSKIITEQNAWNSLCNGEDDGGPKAW